MPTLKHDFGLTPLNEPLLKVLGIREGKTMEWQPIESADHLRVTPVERWRRNPEVLLVMGKTIVIGYWDHDLYAKKPRPMWVAVGPWGRTWCRDNQPKFWMPLPTPPDDLLQINEEGTK